MTTEPAGKIITIRVTSNDPDLSMEDFRLLCRDALGDVSTSTAVMSEHFNVEGQHVPVYAWGKEEVPKSKRSTPVQERTDDLAGEVSVLSKMADAEIHERLNAAEAMVTEMESTEKLTQGHITQMSKDFFMLKTFARGTQNPIFRDRAETLCSRITEVMNDHVKP